MGINHKDSLGNILKAQIFNLISFHSIHSLGRWLRIRYLDSGEYNILKHLVMKLNLSFFWWGYLKWGS
jgi:hypothetical protein